MLKHVLAASLLFTSADHSAVAAQTGTASPTLSMSYREGSGCAGLFLYAWNDDRSEVLTIKIDQSAVRLLDGSTKFDLATSGPDVAVHVERTDGPREALPFCSDDTAAAKDQPTTWAAVRGSLKVMLKRRSGLTPVNVEVEDLVVRSPAGIEVKARRTIRFTAAIDGMTP